MAIDSPVDIEPQEQESAFPVLSRALSARGGNSRQSMALRQRSIEDREHIAGQQFELHSQQTELSKVHQLSEIMKERMRVSDSMEKQRQTMHFLKGLNEIPHDAAPMDFEKRVAELGYEHPAALDDKFISQALVYRRKSHLLRETMQNQLAVHGEMERSQARAAAEREAAQNRHIQNENATMYARSRGSDVYNDEFGVPSIDETRKQADALGLPVPGGKGSKEHADSWKAFAEETRGFGGYSPSAFASDWAKDQTGNYTRTVPAQGDQNITQTIPPDVHDQFRARYKELAGGAHPPAAPSTSSASASAATTTPTYTDPAQVKAAFKAGQLSQNDAVAILQKQFGHE